MPRTLNRTSFGAGLLTAIIVAACGGGTAASPTPAIPTGSAGPVSTNAPIATGVSTGRPFVQAATTAEAGTVIPVTWTGPNAQGDFVTIVVKGATAWTNEDYFYTTEGSPASLNTTSVAGPYEIWYVSGADNSILARQDITLTPFAGALQAPDSVGANTEFEVSWVGPNGLGDYVTIVKAGATQWTNEDYFYTTEGPTAKLLAPVDAGPYEIWYVTGSDSKIQARRPITLTPVVATVDAPLEVTHGTSFEASWTGPNGPGDFITIVPVGSTPSTYMAYFSTSGGPTGSLLAPDQPGNYEVRYVAGQKDVVFATHPIKVN